MRHFLFLIVVCSLAALSCHRAQRQQELSQKEPAGHAVDSMQPPLVYQTYGLPEPYHDKAMRRVFRRYGVGVTGVAGCVVDDSLITRVERNNTAVYAALRGQLGPDAKDSIDQMIVEEATIQQKAEGLLLREKLVRLKQKELSKELPYASLDFVPQPGPSAGSFVVDADVQRYTHDSLSHTPWRQFLVDTARKTVLVKGSNGAWTECTKGME